MRRSLDLAGYWDGRLTLDPDIDVDAPAVIEQPFYVPLSWSGQIEPLRFPPHEPSMSGVVRPIQNQNFRDVMRKFHEGVITYRKRIDLPEADPRLPCAVLVLEGANYATAVEVNGQHVGSHEGGHLAFEMDVTDALTPGANELSVTVDNRRRIDAAPQEQFNWRNYGGIYRPIRLEWRPALHLTRLRATPGRDSRGWFATVSLQLNRPGDVNVDLLLRSGERTCSHRVELRDGDEAQAVLRIDDPIVWRPGMGGMSELTATVTPIDPDGGGDGASVDRLTLPMGFRTVAVEGRRILINDEPIRLLGAALHEQHPTFGASIPPWQADQDVALMRHAGLNAVRAAHYPHAGSFYDACDRAGMLVVAEMPCWQFNEQQFANPGLRDFCRAYARDMVDQLGGHPSVIGWIVQNESRTFDPAAAPFFEAIHEAFKQADASRLTLSAESPHPPEHLAVGSAASPDADAGDPTGAEASAGLPGTSRFIDVLGINHYAGWYADKAEAFDQTLDRVTAARGDRPVIVSEFGAEGIAGERSLMMAPWTEDYQAHLVMRHVEAILARDELAGFFIWLFADYECASIGIRAINAKGLVDPHRRPKLLYDLLRQRLTAPKHSPGRS